MDLPFEKFEKLSPSRQLHLLYLKMSEVGLPQDMLRGYLKRCREEGIHRFADLELSPHAVEEVMAALEKQLGRTPGEIMTVSVNVREGDGSLEKTETIPLNIVLHNLRSAFNVGSIFRTAECVGVQNLHLSGYTPTPDDAPVAKTCMGTGERVVWEKLNIGRVFDDQLDNQAGSIIAVETVQESHCLFEFEFPEKCTLLFGNERLGLEKELLERADQVISIPVFGWKNSLNVASAFSIVCYEYRRQFEAKS